MWDLKTINNINQAASKLAQEGKPERDAMIEVGIIAPTIEAKDKAIKKVFAERMNGCPKQFNAGWRMK